MKQKDIAEKLGLSQMTVSYALRGSPKVSATTREKVLAMAKQLGYRPHHAAQSLRTGRTGLIAPLGLRLNPTAIHGLGIDEAAITYFAQHLHQHGYELSARYAANFSDAFRLPPWQVDGAVLIHANSESDYQDVEEQGIPYVTINSSAPPQGVSILPNDVEGTAEAMEHLIELGHKKIAFAFSTDVTGTHQSFVARQGEYLRTLRQAGLNPAPGYDQPVTDRVRYIADQVLRGQTTAILAYHTYLGVELLQAASSIGVQIPGELSLVTFNNVYPAEQVYPKLTAVALPVEEMGALAAESLTSQIESGERIHKTIVLSEHLIIRDSTSPARE